MIRSVTDSMNHDLAKNDISVTDRFSAGLIFIAQHIFKTSKAVENMRVKNLKKMHEKLQKKRLREGLVRGRILQVDRKKDLSEKDFIEKYVKKQIPVIFDGVALDWPCVKKWNVDYLLQKYSNEKFPIVTRVGLMEDSEAHGDISTKEFSEVITISDFVKNLRGIGDKYMRFSPIMESKNELIEDMDQSWLKRMRQCFFGVSYQTFIGAKGKTTPLHGGESTSFFSIVAEGEKTWDLISAAYYPFINPNADGYGYNFSKVDLENPDLEKYPGVNLIHRYRCTLKKGDVLYIPAWMWHQVRNDAESWTVSYRFTNIRAILHQYVFVFIRIFFTEPSVLKTVYYSILRVDLPNREDKLLTPRLFK